MVWKEKGEIIKFNVRKGKVEDGNENVMNGLIEKVFGKLYGDKGYICESVFGRVWDKGVDIVRGVG